MENTLQHPTVPQVKFKTPSKIGSSGQKHNRIHLIDHRRNYFVSPIYLDDLDLIKRAEQKYLPFLPI